MDDRYIRCVIRERALIRAISMLNTEAAVCLSLADEIGGISNPLAQAMRSRGQRLNAVARTLSRAHLNADEMESCEDCGGRGEITGWACGMEGEVRCETCAGLGYIKGEVTPW